jgi:hypothetical protein
MLTVNASKWNRWGEAQTDPGVTLCALLPLRCRGVHRIELSLVILAARQSLC